MDSREKLNTELETLLYWLSLSKAEIQIRRKIRDEIQSIVTNSTDSCKIDMVGSFVSGMMLPDSGLDFCCATNDVKFDSSRVFSAITVSAQYQEILQEFEEDGSCLITCQHIYSGIKLNISFEKEVNTSFTYFIRYAKRVAGFRSLYTIFRYFLKQNNIPSDNNHSMVLYLLVIFYLQMCVKGRAESMLLADLFADFLTQICRLSMLLPSAQRGYSFFRYARSVEQKLAVRLDLESRESERLFRRISKVCESSAAVIQRFVEAKRYDGHIAAHLFTNYPRITQAMQESQFFASLKNDAEEGVRKNISLDSCRKPFTPR